MSKVYETPFSAAEQQFLVSKLFRYHTVDSCHIWYGSTNLDGYAIIKVMFRGKRQTFTVHRLQYFLANNCAFSDHSYHVSHLCHKKLCINIEHLSLEPGHINVERNTCKNLRACKGHDGFKNCIF